jgi:hypothetical protein
MHTATRGVLNLALVVGICSCEQHALEEFDRFATAMARALEVGGTVAGKLAAALARAVAAVDWGAVGRQMAVGFARATTNFTKEISPKGKSWTDKVVRALLNPPGIRILGEILGDEAQAAGKKAQVGLSRGMAGIGHTVAVAFAPGIQAVEAQAAQAGAAGYNVGVAAAAGMQQGIFSRIGAVAAAAVSMVAQAIGAARVAADARSPSRKMEREVGRPLAEGILLGFLNGTATCPRRSPTGSARR